MSDEDRRDCRDFDRDAWHDGVSSMLVDEWADLDVEAVLDAIEGELGDEIVTIETMPEHLRASHEAAGNRGVWPHNGATRTEMSRVYAAAAVVADPEWTSIVE